MVSVKRVGNISVCFTLCVSALKFVNVRESESEPFKISSSKSKKSVSIVEPGRGGSRLWARKIDYFPAKRKIAEEWSQIKLFLYLYRGPFFRYRVYSSL